MERNKIGDFTASASQRVYRISAKTDIDTKVTSTSSVMFPTSLRLLEIASAIPSATQRAARWRYLIIYVPYSELIWRHLILANNLENCSSIVKNTPRAPIAKILFANFCFWLNRQCLTPRYMVYSLPIDV